jgi:hypothetical protein
VTLWEINAYQDELKRRLVERSYRLLARAQIIRWYELAGMHSYGDRHGWISTPIIQNDPVYAALLALGLEVVDAQHVFAAVKQKCNVFLTCDRDIRDCAAAIKDRFELIVQKPSDFVASQGW